MYKNKRYLVEKKKIMLVCIKMEAKLNSFVYLPWFFHAGSLS